ncbi:thiamin pyrophosphokinase 1 isoform X2 [Venturia canescens]|uniref:thiamin pyrophosphokinase 1 isoform X2 n=1 Tax=Venturia canescens TaxID=32260 RepID=UPI001C9CD5F6|nr:thiamin pyrophosphokinase 1 isoform X2 [Venturia canescens]
MRSSCSTHLFEYRNTFYWPSGRKVTLTVDGGTNQWMEYLGDVSEGQSEECTIYRPTLITGDMDSISPEIKEKLEKSGSKVIPTIDQNLTDYTKALIELRQHCESQNIELHAIYVIVDTSGRLDHLVGNLNTLYKTPKLLAHTQVIQVASNSLTWLLTPGRHKIIIPEVLARSKSWCGILPLNGKVDKILSSGLKWNLNNITMEFGGLVSTSNTYEDECTEVKIELHDLVVWTMGIEPLLDQSCPQ